MQSGPNKITQCWRHAWLSPENKIIDGVKSTHLLGETVNLNNLGWMRQSFTARLNLRSLREKGLEISIGLF